MCCLADGIDEDLVDPGNPLIDGVIAELSGADGEESADSTESTRFFGESVVDEWGDWS